MKFAYIPRAEYHIGQKLTVLGIPVVVERYSHTGFNIIVTTLPGAAKFERIVGILADADQFIHAKDAS